MNPIPSPEFCRNCGENISDEIAFCRGCGTALSDKQVQTNIDHSRKQASIHLAIQQENSKAPSIRKITGAIVIGLMEISLVVLVFAASILISINLLPGAEESGSFWKYFTVMATVCISGLAIGSYLSNIFCEKYQEKLCDVKRYFHLEEHRL